MTILVYDRPSAAAALARDLPYAARAALVAELALLTSGEHDLTDWTDIVLVQPGDSPEAVEREVGFDPLADPITGAPDGEPGWDLLTLRGGVFRAVFTFGSTHATVLLVPDGEGSPPELLDPLRRRAAA